MRRSYACIVSLLVHRAVWDRRHVNSSFRFVRWSKSTRMHPVSCISELGGDSERVSSKCNDSPCLQSIVHVRCST